MVKVYVVEDEKGETIASFDTKKECVEYLGTTVRGFDSKMYHLKSGFCQYARIKDTGKKVRIYIVEVEDEQED